MRNEPLNDTVIKEMKGRWAKREVDPLMLRSLEGAGRDFRAFSLRRTMPLEWFSLPYYKLLYEERGVHDCIIAAFPVVVHASAERGELTVEDIDLGDGGSAPRPQVRCEGADRVDEPLAQSAGLAEAAGPNSP